jgi:hypothetical protein
MRSNDRLRRMWRGIASPAPVRGSELDALAARISKDGARALRATHLVRAAAVAGILVGVAAGIVIMETPTRPNVMLLEAISGGEAPERSFEAAAVGPRDGTWVIAAAVGSDQ